MFVKLYHWKYSGDRGMQYFEDRMLARLFFFLAMRQIFAK